MGIYSYRTVLLARGNADLANVSTIGGLALEKNDASGTSDTTETSTNTQRVGWVNGHRREPVLYQPLTGIPTNGRTMRAIYHLFTGGSVGNGVFKGGLTVDASGTPGTAQFEVWAVRVGLNSDLSGLDWDSYNGSDDWDEPGAKFGVGHDLSGSRLGVLSLTQSQYDALIALGGGQQEWQIDMRAELQNLLDFELPLQLIFRALWPSGGTNTSDNRYVLLNQPSSSGGTVHDYLEWRGRNALECYLSDLAGNLDQTQLLDLNSDDVPQHLYEGTPPRGSVGPQIKAWTRNELASAQTGVVMLPSRAVCGSVNNSAPEAASHTGRLAYVEVFDNATGQGTPNATWRATFSTATAYAVSRKLFGETSFSTTGLGGHTGLSTSGDNTVTYNGDDAVTFPILAWSGTFVSGDVVEVQTFADLHTPARPLSTLDSIKWMPYLAGDRSQPDSSHARVMSHGVCQQVYRHDTRTIANSSGATGMVATVSDSGSFSHVKVPNPLAYTVDDWATLAVFDATGETVGVKRVEQVQIKAVYARDHATYPGQVRLYQNLSSPTNFDGRSILTTGLWNGLLAAAPQAFLASTATTTTNLISIDGTIAGLTDGDSVTLIDLDTGLSETKIVATGGISGSTIRFTSNPSRDYPPTSVVVKTADTVSNVPWWSFGQPPADIQKGRKSGNFAAMAWAVT